MMPRTFSHIGGMSAVMRAAAGCAATWVLLVAAACSSKTAGVLPDDDVPDGPQCVFAEDCGIRLVCSNGRCVDPAEIDPDDETDVRDPLDPPSDNDDVPPGDDDVPPGDDDVPPGDDDPDDGSPDGDDIAPDDADPDDADQDPGDPDAVVRITFNEPVADAVLDGAVMPSLNVVPTSRVGRVEFLIDDVQVAVGDAPSFAPLDPINFRQVPEGRRRLTARAVGRGEDAPVLGETTIEVFVDRTAPVVEVTSPPSGLRLCAGQTLELRFTASDNVRLKSINVTVGRFVREVPVNADGSSNYRIDIPVRRAADAADTEGFDPGPVSVQVTAVDFNRTNATKRVSVPVVFDNEAPVWSIEGLNPAQTEFIPRGPATLTVTDCSGFAAGSRIILRRGTTEVRTFDLAGAATPFTRSVDFDEFLPDSREYPYDLSFDVSVTDGFGNTLAVSPPRVVRLTRRLWSEGRQPRQPDKQLSQSFFRPRFTSVPLALNGDETRIVGGLAFLFFGLDSLGLPRWSCQTAEIDNTDPINPELGYISTPVRVVENLGFALDGNGRLYVQRNVTGAAADNSCESPWRLSAALVYPDDYRNTVGDVTPGPWLTPGPKTGPGKFRFIACGVRAAGPTRELFCRQFEYDDTGPVGQVCTLCETTGFMGRTNMTAAPMYVDWGAKRYVAPVGDTLMSIAAFSGTPDCRAGVTPPACPIDGSFSDPEARSVPMGTPIGRIGPAGGGEAGLFVGIARKYNQLGVNLLPEPNVGYTPDAETGLRSESTFNQTSPVIGADGIHYVVAAETRLGRSVARLLGFPVPFTSSESAATVRIDLESSVLASPVAGADGVVYVAETGDRRGVIAAADPRTGRVLWRTTSGSTQALIYSDLVMSSQGVVYYLTNDLQIHAVQSNARGPAASDWPMAGRTAQRRADFVVRVAR